MVALNTRRADAVAWAPPLGEVTTLVATATGTWPAGTRMVVGDRTDTIATGTVLGSAVISVDGLTATWALDEAQCAILRAHTRLLVQVPSGAAWDGVLAGAIAPEPVWSGARSVQTIGSPAGTTTWAGITDKPAVIAAGADAAAARTAIGAGTSSLVIGTGAGDAKAGNYTPPDATASVKGLMQLAGDLAGTAAAPTVVAASETVAGKVELATTAEATTGTDTVRAVTPAGLKAVADTKAAASHTHPATGISDSTTVGRTLVTAADAAAARSAIGAGTSNLTTEDVQDTIGGMVVGAGGTYDDGAGSITLPGGGGSSTITADDTPAAPAEGEGASYFVTSAVTWPAGLVWSTDPDGGTAPTITGAALVSLFTVGGVTRAIMGATFPAPVVPDTTAPTVPAGLSATATSTTTVDLSWSASTDAGGVTGYEYAINAAAAVDAGAGTTETVSGLTAATLYSFTVRAYDAAGNRSAWSTAATATTQAAADTTAPTWTATFTMGTPTETAAVATASALATDNSGSVTYEVSYNNAATWAAIVPSGSNFTLAGSPSTTYATTKLRAKDAAGNRSAWLSVPSYTMAAGGPSILAADSFTRADNASAIGTTEVGGLTWETTQTWGIKDGGARLYSGVGGRALVDLGITSGYKVSCRFAMFNASLWSQLIVNSSAGEQLFVERQDAGAVSLWRKIGTNESTKVFDVIGGLPSTSSVLSVAITATTAEVFVDGVSRGSGPITPTGHKVGFQAAAAAGTGAHFDDFEVVAL